MFQLSLEKEEQERHELRKMIMGENDDMRKRDKKKIDDDDSMQFSSTGQPGITAS